MEARQWQGLSGAARKLSTGLPTSLANNLFGAKCCPEVRKRIARLSLSCLDAGHGIVQLAMSRIERLIQETNPADQTAVDQAMSVVSKARLGGKESQQLIDGVALQFGRQPFQLPQEL